MNATRYLICASLLLVMCTACSRPEVKNDWQGELSSKVNQFGHRNWILIVDKAFPALNTSGMEILQTDADIAQVVAHVIKECSESAHVKPVVYRDEEFSYVSDKLAPGAGGFRARMDSLLGAYPAYEIRHDSLFSVVLEKTKMFKVLLVKTMDTIPYSSVFIELDCKYWSDEKEKELRSQMEAAIRK